MAQDQGQQGDGGRLSPDEARISSIYRDLVVQAWADPAFKQRLLADPKAVLGDRGLELPPYLDVQVVESAEPIDGQNIKIVEPTAGSDRWVAYAQLPPKPKEEELSDEQLDQVAGGLAGLYSVYDSSQLRSFSYSNLNIYNLSSKPT